MAAAAQLRHFLFQNSKFFAPDSCCTVCDSRWGPFVYRIRVFWGPMNSSVRLTDSFTASYWSSRPYCHLAASFYANKTVREDGWKNKVGIFGFNCFIFLSFLVSIPAFFILIKKPTRCTNFSKLIPGIKLYMFYAFFWVIPRRRNFIYRRFETLCLFHLHRQVGMKMEQTVCSETSAYRIQTPGNYPEESI